MKELSGEINEEEHLKGSFIVPAKSSVQFSGSLTGTLYIDSGAKVMMVGEVSGEIFNRGGFLIISGTVFGTVNTLDGETTIQGSGKIIPLDQIIHIL